MSLNWKALAPHRPLASGEAAYVAPPSGFAERIARQVAAGTSTVLVTGPVGVGKSTELAQAAMLLQSTHTACLVQIDRKENLRQLTAEQMLLRIAGSLGEMLGPRISRDLRASLVEAGMMPQNLESALAAAAAATLRAMNSKAPPPDVPFRGSARSLARAAIHEVTRLSPEGRVALLLDGLEKLPEGPKAMEVLAALGEVGDEFDLIVVVPWFAAFGGFDEVIRPGAHLVPVPACEVEGDIGEPGRRFLLDILARRLGLPYAYFEPGPIAGTKLTDVERIVSQRRELILDAARWSGGLPRTFLQLVADAAQYAQIRRGSDELQMQDLADAVADQTDSYRRALLPGDTEAIHKVRGTDGREMALDRKIRLLARGIILERARGSGWSIDVHPLVRPLLGLADHA